MVTVSKMMENKPIQKFWRCLPIFVACQYSLHAEICVLELGKLHSRMTVTEYSDLYGVSIIDEII